MAIDGGPGGAKSLLSLRNEVRAESDTEDDPHITDDNLNRWINSSRFELYDILVTRFTDDYYTSTAQCATDGVTQSYPLPDGVTYSEASLVWGDSDAFYKGLLVEIVSGGGVVPGQPITLNPFTLREKNRFVAPAYVVAAPYTYPRYRVQGSTLMFDRVPAGGLGVKLWYAPRLAPLVNDTDVADDWSGWLEYVIVDAAIKAIGKQERDPALLVARKVALSARIEAAAANRNAGDPPTVSETSVDGLGGFGIPGYPSGPFGGGY